MITISICLLRWHNTSLPIDVHCDFVAQHLKNTSNEFKRLILWIDGNCLKQFIQFIEILFFLLLQKRAFSPVDLVEPESVYS